MNCTPRNNQKATTGGELWLRNSKSEAGEHVEHNLLFLGLPESRCPQLRCRSSGLGPRGTGLESGSSELCGHLMPGLETGKPRPRLQSPGKKVRLSAQAICTFWTHDWWVPVREEQGAPKAKRCQLEKELLQSEASNSLRGSCMRSSGRKCAGSGDAPSQRESRSYFLLIPVARGSLSRHEEAPMVHEQSSNTLGPPHPDRKKQGMGGRDKNWAFPATGFPTSHPGAVMLHGQRMIPKSHNQILQTIKGKILRAL